MKVIVTMTDDQWEELRRTTIKQLYALGIEIRNLPNKSIAEMNIEFDAESVEVDE